jgi:hypothetical protein
MMHQILISGFQDTPVAVTVTMVVMRQIVGAPVQIFT